MPECGFLILWIFLLFFRNFLVVVEYKRNSGIKFFILFLGLSHPILARNNAGSMFSIFFFFGIFLGIFLARVEYERNSGLTFFSIFLGLSHPVLARNNAGKRFFNFLIFISIFLGIFLRWSSMNGIRVQNFFFSFSAYLIPFWQKIMPERGFLIFWIFLQFLSELSCPGQVWMEFGTKIVFSLSRPISSRFG